MKARMLAGAAVAALLLTLTSPAHSYPPPGATQRVSPLEDVEGQPADAGWQTISDDGRFVAFVTTHPLVAGDTNGDQDVYLRDLETGELERASLTDADGEANGHSTAPSISRDARFIAFRSDATNLVASDPNARVYDIYVRDRVAGTTTLVAVSSAEVQANAASSDPDISGDGRAVAFYSTATNLVAGDTNGTGDVFVRDLVAGITVRASISSDGEQGAIFSEMPAIDHAGRFVAFRSQAPNLVPGDTNPANDIFVHDLATRTTQRVSVASDGSEGMFASFYPSISGDGRYVAFGSFSENFTPNDMNGAVDAFVHDRSTGRTERVIVGNAGTVDDGMGVPVISSDGRYVTGNVWARGPIEGDANETTDVWVYDRATGSAELASVSVAGGTGNAISHSPGISGDGRRVVFYSDASDLVDDGVGGPHLYVRELGPGLGIGSVTAERTQDGTIVSGWARVRGASLLRVEESGSDAGPAARAALADLTAAELVYRPEREDLLVRFDLSPATNTFWPTLVGTSVRKPSAVVYGLDLSIASLRHEIRAVGGPDGHSFALHRCAPECQPVATLTGTIGMLGERVTVEVPLKDLGVAPGAILVGRTAYTAAGSSPTGGLRRLDEVGLTDASIPNASVALGVAPAGTPSDDVAFDTPAAFSEGRFSGTVPSPLAPGQKAWARVCLGASCGASPAPLE